jgi:hypothetical protein
MTRHFTLILQILVVAFFALTGCPATSTSGGGDVAVKETNNIPESNSVPYSDWEASPLAGKIKDLIKGNPDYSHRHEGWCGNPSADMTYAFQGVVSGAPAEDIIPLLNHQAPYLRAAVNNVLRTSIENSKPVIEDAFNKGNDRMKLELLQYVEPDATYERKIELLAKIIADPTQPVFYEDTYYLYRPGVCLNAGTISGYPVDIFTFYLRLMREAGWEGDRDAAMDALGKFGAEASGAVPYITKLMNESRKSTQYDNAYGSGPIESVDVVAIKALGDIGPSASTAIPDLVKLYNDKSLEYHPARFTVASSLYLIGHKKSEMVKYLVNELNNPCRANGQFTLTDNGVYPPILGNLQRIGPDAKAALPKLKELALRQAREDHTVREDALAAISAIEGDYKSVVPVYLKMLTLDPDLRDEAIQNLWWIRDKTDLSPELPHLLKAMYEPGGNQYTLFDLLMTFPGHDDEIVDGAIYIYKQDPDGENVLLTVSHRLGNRAKALLPIAKEMINSIDGKNLTSGVSVYVAVGGAEEWVFDTLVKKTYSQNEKEVDSAISGFRYLKELRTKSYSRLEQMTQSKSANVSRQAKLMISLIKADIEMEASRKK